MVPSDGFLSVVYTCTYVEQSAQALHVEISRDHVAGFPEPDPSERYTDVAVSPAVYFDLAKAFQVSLSRQRFIRVKADLPGAKQVRFQVTVPGPKKGLDAPAAIGQSLPLLERQMSKGTEVLGSCSAAAADEHLPPRYRADPDDT